MRRLILLLLGLFALAAPGAARAAEPIVLGNTLPMSGPLEAAGKAARTGIEAYLARVRREGGVAGRSVVLRTLDDAYQPERYAENLRRLFEQERVQALVLAAGTSNIDGAYGLVQQAGKPVIGVLTGAAALRSAERPLLYHLRASYGDEVRRLLDQAAAVSQRRVYAVWQDDGLGRDAFAALQAALAERRMELVGQRGVAPATMDGAALAEAVRASRAEALFALCITPCAGKMLAGLASDGAFKLTTYALSIVNGETLARSAGAAARGTVISQVLPNPHHATTALVRRYQSDVRQLVGRDEFSYFSLEGYVAAMVAVEAARLAYAAPGGRSMDDAMRLLVQREIEGIPVSHGTARGVRPHPVTLSMIGHDGRLIH